MRVILLFILFIPPVLGDEIKAFLEQYRAKYDLPGIVAGYALPGRAGAVAAGHSDEQVPLTVCDKLLSGSIGKTYVSAVALQLVAEGKLDLDAKISRYLGEEAWFPRLANSADVTVRMLMNHTSGIKEHVYNPEFGEAAASQTDRIWKPEEIVAFALDTEPLFPAGEGWAYADTNYIVLGMVIEKLTGRPYYESLKQRVLVPLGLNDTLPSDRRDIPGLVAGYAGPQSPFKKPGKTMHHGKLTVNPQIEWCGGGLACTTLDLARWALALYQGKAFTEELLEPLLQCVSAQTGPGDRYGLGVQIWKSRHGDCYGHGGWFPGYISCMGYYPDLNLAVAVQINTDMVPKGSTVLRDLMDGVAQRLQEIVFATFAGDDEQARHALVLADSIRTFGGAYRHAPIRIYVPAALKGIEEKAKALRAVVRTSRAPDEALRFPFAAKVFAAAQAESEAGAPILAWLDEDTVVLSEPCCFLLDEGTSLGYRPVMHRNIGSLLASPPDEFWSRVYDRLSVPEDRLFAMVTPADQVTIRPYFNAGLLVVRPERGILGQWARCFPKLYQDAALVEMCRKDQLKAVFLHQAALVGAVLGKVKREEMLELSPEVNYPLFFQENFQAKKTFNSIEGLVTIRYDVYFRNPRPGWDERLKGPADRITWLKDRLDAN
jgi:D-alanyl-D-alanine carboxypeptidase